MLERNGIICAKCVLNNHIIIKDCNLYFDTPSCSIFICKLVARNKCEQGLIYCHIKVAGAASVSVHFFLVKASFSGGNANLK